MAAPQVVLSQGAPQVALLFPLHLLYDAALLHPAVLTAQQQAEQEQHHMVWMDDDGSIDALPWDIGSWSVGSKDGSPAGAAEAGQGGTTAGANGAASPGEPVGQEVLITALNRRVRSHFDVRGPRYAHSRHRIAIARSFFL